MTKRSFPKAPQLRVKPSETYSAARVRYKVKFAEWLDYCTMCECDSATSTRHLSTKQRHFLKAFYGIPVPFIMEVLS